jgi:hypothetical protein
MCHRSARIRSLQRCRSLLAHEIGMKAAEPSRRDGGRRETLLTPTNSPPAITRTGPEQQRCFACPAASDSYGAGATASGSGTALGSKGRGKIASAKTSSSSHWSSNAVTTVARHLVIPRWRSWRCRPRRWISRWPDVDTFELVVEPDYPPGWAQRPVLLTMNRNDCRGESVYSPALLGIAAQRGPICQSAPTAWIIVVYIVSME